jgi:drug/metabolite transporter (DMT)-like permease
MSMPLRGSRVAMLGLMAVTAVWGSTFFLIKDLVAHMPVADFLAVRFLIAALAMLVLFLRPLRQLGRREWMQGVALGAVYGVAQLLQTFGLAHTSASISGFATGMYVVFTPLIGTVLLRQRLPPVTWIAVLLSVGGLALLALHGLGLSYGVWLTLASAALYGVHIVGLGAWSRPGRGHPDRSYHPAVAPGWRWRTWRWPPARARCWCRPGRRRTCRPRARPS